MGLERIAAVMQGVHDNYDIDVFVELLNAVGEVVQCKDHSNTSMRVIADHIRSAAFFILDGVLPSNEGRGYVLRRIIRRAIRHGYQLGQTDLFFHQLVPALVRLMGKAYPDLLEHESRITSVIKIEEEQFSNTLDKGLKIFDEQLSRMNLDPGDPSRDIVSGDMVFLLCDTYGFPPDLTADIAREKGLTIDEKGFLEAMSQQRALSQQSLNPFHAQYLPSNQGETHTYHTVKKPYHLIQYPAKDHQDLDSSDSTAHQRS
jgi:alanyl-tRNA synthetase